MSEKALPNEMETHFVVMVPVDVFASKPQQLNDILRQLKDSGGNMFSTAGYGYTFRGERLRLRDLRAAYNSGTHGEPEVTNEDLPAFPSRGGMMFYLPEHARGGIEAAVTQLDAQHSGLTKRELFAAMAMQGWLAGCRDVYNEFTGPAMFPDRMASSCVKFADALLAALECTAMRIAINVLLSALFGVCGAVFKIPPGQFAVLFLILVAMMVNNLIGELRRG